MIVPLYIDVDSQDSTNLDDLTEWLKDQGVAFYQAPTLYAVTLEELEVVLEDK